MWACADGFFVCVDLARLHSCLSVPIVSMYRQRARQGPYFILEPRTLFLRVEFDIGWYRCCKRGHQYLYVPYLQMLWSLTLTYACTDLGTHLGEDDLDVDRMLHLFVLLIAIS
jgi:hypothetical protein